MGEYNNEEFNEEQDDTETKFYEKDEPDDMELENEFEPRDEEQQVSKGFFDIYVPKDEQESYIEQFETEFIPKDEKDLKKLSSKEVDKEIELTKKKSVKKEAKDIKLKESKELAELLCIRNLNGVPFFDSSNPSNRNISLNFGEEKEIKELSTQKLREVIKGIDWDNITKDWKIEIRKNQFPAREIQLNPKNDCSRENPLYKHKIWLKTIYNNERLNLTDKKISEICKVHIATIQNWRKIHNIPAKDWTNGKWVDHRGYTKILMPKGYLHPELVPNKGRNVRFEHVIVMEKYLSAHPELEWSKKYLIDGKYLKLGTVVHHINYDKSDNRLENLCLYENIKSHKKVEKSLNECFRDLIKLDQIRFNNGEYYLNANFDCRDLSSSRINETLKPMSINPYKDINLVKEEIKKINWKEISDDWTVKIRDNQHSEKELLLDPYTDCSDKNPLYLHKEWVDRLVYDKKYNLTQRRLAKLCGVDRGVIFYWSKVKHNINMENEKRGFGRCISSGGRVWMKVPEDYGNPITKKNRGWMYEHRYILERYLTEHPELDWSKKYLIDGKYLKSNCLIHHINFDPLDNRLDNLWICRNNLEHRKLETSLTFFVDDLLRFNFITFKNGKYRLNL